MLESNEAEPPKNEYRGDLVSPDQSQCLSLSQSECDCDCTEKKDASNDSPPGDLEAGHQSGKKKKSLSFFLAFIALLLMVFLVSLDATTLAVAIPVRPYTTLDKHTCSLTSIGNH